MENPVTKVAKIPPVSKPKRRWLFLAGIVVLCAATLEIGGRLAGFTNPPLYVTDPEIEYLLRPNQQTRFFGNRIDVNSHSMRSPEFPAQRAGRELRVMVFGDSVINGGKLTDQRDLATSILQRTLRCEGHEGAWVGNISAGSWGPGNWLAYARRNGFFDANVVVLVVSSSDASDVPSFLPLDPDTHPVQAPSSALAWTFRKAWIRIFPQTSPTSIVHTQSIPPVTSRSSALDDLQRFLQMACEGRRKVVVLHHCEREEVMETQTREANRMIHDICMKLDIPFHSMKDAYRKQMEAGKNPFRDYIHPNDLGQRILFEEMERATRGQLHDAGREKEGGAP